MEGIESFHTSLKGIYHQVRILAERLDIRGSIIFQAGVVLYCFSDIFE